MPSRPEPLGPKGQSGFLGSGCGLGKQPVCLLEFLSGEVVPCRPLALPHQLETSGASDPQGVQFQMSP